MATQVTSEQVMVPDKMVGLIIGKGGEQITRLQAETGCKIQMAADAGGMPERLCTLTGPMSAIAQAKAMIEGIISNEGQGQRGPGGGGGGGMPGMGMGGGGGGGQFEMLIPGHKVGLVIGKGGETIKQLQAQTGAKMIIIQDTNDQADQKPLRISGPPESIEAAKAEVFKILNQNDNRGMGGARGGHSGGRGGGRGGGGAGWPTGGPGDKTEYVMVASNKVGLVIGKGGETIKSINQSSGAHVEIDRNAPPDAHEKNFVIRGPADAVERAKNMVLEKIGAIEVMFSLLTILFTHLNIDLRGPAMEHSLVRPSYLVAEAEAVITVAGAEVTMEVEALLREVRPLTPPQDNLTTAHSGLTTTGVSA